MGTQERWHDNDNKIHRTNLFGPWLPSRPAAKSNGARHYFTGVSCMHGHKAPRVTSSGSCVECAAEWRETHKEEIAENYKRWYAENIEQQKEYNAKWLAENRGSVREKARVRAIGYRAADPEKYAARAMEYYYRNMENPEFRAKQSLRSSIQHGKRKGAKGTFTPEDVAQILERQKYKCAECGTSVRKKANRHIDHITPLAKGGTNWPWNLQILCPKCNLSKGAKDPLDWAKLKGRLV